MAKEEDVIQKFNKWLEQGKWDLPVCPVSKKRNWSAAENLVEFRPFMGGSLVVGGSVYPAVMLVCKDCGYTIFFNAAVTGVA